MTIKLLIKKLISKSRDYLEIQDIEKIQKAFEFASQAHEGQQRKSKDPFISHPLEVALVLVQLEQGLETVIGGILHDVLEDTSVTEKMIEDEFGYQVLVLVKGVTKLSNLKFESKIEAQVENYRRMFMAMAEDFRVIIIKLADRLHNLRTLQYMSPSKQIEIAQETLDIYAPLAHRLGIFSIKWELEDLAFLYTHPEDYYQMKDQIEMKRGDRDHYIQEMIEAVKKQMSKLKIKSDIQGRSKHLYSIYKKMKTKNIQFNEMYDLLGIRIIVDDLLDCYRVVGVIHNKFKPVSERFKDYIALPKPNGYQSLHTTVLGSEGRLVEIQVRTFDMEHTAEFGFAAHWHYKSKKSMKKFEGELTWLTQMIEDQKETLTPVDFLQTLKVDLYMDEVFVFTPKGQVKILSRGATALDFAYSIHTEIGHQCKKVLVNGAFVSLDYELQNGDRIEIVTSKEVIPNVGWLSFVTSRHSRYKIKQWLNKQKKEDLILRGKRRLEKTFFIEGLVLTDCLKHIDYKKLKKRFHLSHMDDLYLFVEQGDVSQREILRFFIKEIKPQESPKVKLMSRQKSSFSGTKKLASKAVKFTLAQCCSPLPGDEIGGIVVPGKGVSVHRMDCINIISVQKKSKDRMIEVSWDQEETQHQYYRCTMRIEGFDRDGLLHDILNVIYDSKFHLRAVTTKVFKDDTRMGATLVVDLQNIRQFYDIKRAMSAISDVYNVSRVNLGMG